MPACAQLAQQYRRRRAVKGDVVQGELEEVALRLALDAYEHAAQDRRALAEQREAARRFRLGEVPPAGAASKGVVKDARALYDQFPQFCDPPGRAPDGVAGVLLFGYPLHHKNQDRSPPLRGMVAAGVPVLVVSGDKDPFNVGLAEVVADMGNVDANNSHTAATFVEIAGGGHDVWSPFDAARHAAIHSAVSAFMSDCWAAS